MKARIELQTALSYQRAGGRLYKRGKPALTADRAEIEWAEATSGFSVTRLDQAPVKSKAKGPGLPRGDDNGRGAPAAQPPPPPRRSRPRASSSSKKAKAKAKPTATDGEG